MSKDPMPIQGVNASLSEAAEKSRQELHAAWTELRGYVSGAVEDGGTINPTDMAAYMDELKQKWLQPIREAMDELLKR